MGLKSDTKFEKLKTYKQSSRNLFNVLNKYISNGFYRMTRRKQWDTDLRQICLHNTYLGRFTRIIKILIVFVYFFYFLRKDQKKVIGCSSVTRLDTKCSNHL
jgi:hypothetical protein